MSLQAIIWDMDGVICDTERFHTTAWREAAETYAVPFSDDLARKIRGHTRRRSAEILVGGESPPEGLIEQLMDFKNSRYLQLIDNMHINDILPGVFDLLKEAKEAAILNAIASSSQHVRRVLERLGIMEYFAAISDGNFVTKSKPDPMSYVTAAGLLALPPTACVAIEDSDDGILSATRAGMCVLGIGDDGGIAHAHAVTPTLTGITLYLLQRLHDYWLDALTAPDQHGVPGQRRPLDLRSLAQSD